MEGKELLRGILAKACREEFGFEPEESGGSTLLILDDSLREKPLIAEVGEGGLVIRNICPSEFWPDSEAPEGSTFEEDGWVSLRLAGLHSARLREVEDSVRRAFRTSKRCMEEALKSGKESSLKFYKCRLVSVLGRKFVLASLRRGGSARFWAPYPVVSREGSRYYIIGVWGPSNYPFISSRGGKVLLIGGGRAVEIPVRTLASKLADIFEEMENSGIADFGALPERLREEPEIIFSEEVLEALRRGVEQSIRAGKAGMSKALLDVRDLLERVRRQESELESIAVAKLFLRGDVGEVNVGGSEEAVIRVRTRKVRGYRVVTLRESDFGVEFPKEVIVRLLKSSGKRYLVVELD